MKNEKTFEEMSKELEAKVKHLENEELELEKRIELYGECILLHNACQEKLSKAELIIQTLNKKSES